MSEDAFGALLLALTSGENKVTKGEQVRFDELTDEARAIVQVASMRLNTRIISLDKAQREYAKAEDDWLESIVIHQEDDLDDFETGYWKANASRAINATHNEKSMRLNWEMRDAAKISITPARNY